MRTIYKYPIGTTDRCVVNMPPDAEVLCVQVQHGKPCVWAIVDPEATSMPRIFATYGTDHPLGRAFARRYVGTYQLSGGSLVFHVFEESDHV